MLKKDSPLIGIITARASAAEQRQTLSGILSKAEKLGMDTAVFSNLYSFMEYHAAVEVENKIYELMLSHRLCGLIFTAESVFQASLLDYIYNLMKKADVPVVVIDSDRNDFISINTDVRKDFSNIARHLVEEHGVTDIQVLTGYDYVETSIERVKGVKDVFDEKNIPFSEEKVIYGDFWMNSGEALAEDYISGKRKLPQAVICTNDYMAYGLIDRLFDSNINLPEDLLVTGYEYVGERIYHSPLLTTYQRNRKAMGEKAVSTLYNMLTGSPKEDISTEGYMICGESCPCGTDRRHLGEELKTIRQTQFYTSLNLCGNFEQQLTVCQSIPEYIRTLQEFAYLIRGAEGIYLCLYENWCSLKEKSDLNKISNNETMVCYRVISPERGTDEPLMYTRHMLFPTELPGAGKKKFLYFVPIFSSGMELGYFIIQYTRPNGYDTIINDWMKIAVNALLVLRMKNDITILLECKSLSEFHDTLTGLYNPKGFATELDNIIKRTDKNESIMLVGVKTCLFTDKSRIDSQGMLVRLDSEIAESMKKVAVGQNAICSKMENMVFMFAVAGEFGENFAESVADKLEVLISHSPLYRSECGIDTIVSTSLTVSAEEAVPNDIISEIVSGLNEKTKILTERHRKNGCGDYTAVRNLIYLSPEKSWDAQETCRDFRLSYGHFRAAYKDIFGISFHQDLIRSRISMAKYLLLTTSLSLPAIAYKCGYEDEKYFMRQFRQFTSLTPNAYRNSNMLY